MILLTKEEFIKYLDFMDEQEVNQEQFVKALEGLCKGNRCDCFLFSDYADVFIELLCKLMNDKNKDIEHFIYEMEKGKSIFFNDVNNMLNLPYHNAEELYDYLVKMDMEEQE